MRATTRRSARGVLIGVWRRSRPLRKRSRPFSHSRLGVGQAHDHWPPRGSNPVRPQTCRSLVPTNAEPVKATMRGIRRSVGTAPARKAPATADKICAMAANMPDGLIGLRDTPCCCSALRGRSAARSWSRSMWPTSRNARLACGSVSAGRRLTRKPRVSSLALSQVRWPVRYERSRRGLKRQRSWTGLCSAQSLRANVSAPYSFRTRAWPTS